MMMSKRYYVLAPTHQRFIAWLQATKHKLEECTYLGQEEQMLGIDFSNPDRELIVLEDHFRGKPRGYDDAAATLLARYCLQRRVHHVGITKF